MCDRVFGYSICNGIYAIFLMSLKVTINSQIDIFSYFVWILLRSCDVVSTFHHIQCIFEEYWSTLCESNGVKIKVTRERRHSIPILAIS